MIDQVEKFYRELWEAERRELLSEICHADFKFRGSLGSKSVGHDEFWDYLLMVRSGLSNYRCEIEETVSEGNRVFAKMRFSGLHSRQFMNFPASGLKVSWQGAALFTFEENKIAELWVLGDLHSLLKILEENQNRQNK